MVRISFALLLLPLLFNPHSMASDRDSNAGGAAIDEAVRRGVGYIKSKQGKDGSWDRAGHENGVTALAAYALIKANCPLTDSAVASGLKFLLNSDACSNSSRAATYEVSLVAMALASAIEKEAERKAGPAPDFDMESCRFKLKEAADWLVAAQHDCRQPGGLARARRSVGQSGRAGVFDLAQYRGAVAGGWGYRLADSNYADNSNTQFALLGLRSAQNIHDGHSGTNIAIPREVWKKALARLVSLQSGSGEWDYGTPATGARGFHATMTAAGIGGIVICLSSLMPEPDLREIAHTPEILDALDRLEKLMYPPPNTFRLGAAGVMAPDRSGYMLYSLERACMLAGIRKLGPHDWYKEGAAHLLGAQRSDGSWSAGAWYSASDSRHKAPAFRDNTIETGFAVLFLARGCVSTPASASYGSSEEP